MRVLAWKACGLSLLKLLQDSLCDSKLGPINTSRKQKSHFF